MDRNLVVRSMDDEKMKEAKRLMLPTLCSRLSRSRESARNRERASEKEKEKERKAEREKEKKTRGPKL